MLCRSFVASLVVAVVLSVSATSASAVEDLGLQEIAARAYVDRFGGSMDRAYERLAFQDAVAPALSRIEAALGANYAGAWFDANDDGRLVLAVADQDLAESDGSLEAVRELLRARGALSRTSVVDVAWTLKTLKDAQEAVTERVEKLGSRGGVKVAVDLPTNALVVTRSATAGEVADDEISAARAISPAPVREIVVPGEVAPTTKACTLPYCDRPLRGGVRIFNNFAIHCTAAFNAKSRSDGKRYLLTAGHCLGPSETWRTKIVAWGAPHDIGPAHNWYYNFGDAGIIRVAIGTYWNQSPFPGPHVVVDASGGTSYNETYPIHNEANAAVGQIICATSGGGTNPYWGGTPYESWTWCGVTEANPVTVYYDGVIQVDNLVQTNLCFHPGMSGSPGYKTNLAFGIVSGDWCTGGHQEGYLYPTILAENYLNVDIVH